MDDGSFHNQGLHLNTYGFTTEEILKLKQTVENMFGENSLKCLFINIKKEVEFIYGKKVWNY